MNMVMEEVNQSLAANDDFPSSGNQKLGYEFGIRDSHTCHLYLFPTALVLQERTA